MSAKDKGPIKNRRCRDVLFLILFVLFWIGMFVIAGFAIKTGDLNRLVYGIDVDGNLCGNVNGAVDLTDKKFLYYFNPVKPSTTYKRCVSNCPNATGELICQYGVDSTTDIPNKLSSGKCFFSIKSKQILNRCIPSDISGLVNLTNTLEISLSDARVLMGAELNARTIASQLFQSLYNNWKWILLCAGVAFVASFLWLVVMQIFTGFVVWTSLVSVIALTFGCTGYLWFLFWEFKNGRSTELLGFNPLESIETNSKALMAIAIVFSVITLILFLIIVASRKNINLAIDIIKEAAKYVYWIISRAVRALPALIFLPVLKYVAILALFSWCIFIFAILATSGKTVASAFDNATQEYVGDNFSPQTIYYFLIIYYVLGLYWTWNFIIGMGQCSIAGSVAAWYWTRDKKDLASFAVLKSVYRTIRYHMGSIAFGALLVAIIQTIQFLLVQIQRRLKAANNKVAMAILSVLQFIFCCLEKLVQLLNKNAYIEIAVYGYSYCEASQKAYNLIMSNSLRLVAIDGVSSFILFAGKLSVTIGTTALGAYLLRRENELMTMYAVPLIIIAVISWVIASCFVSIDDMAIDTIFLCFCEDCEHNDGSAEKPYYMPDGLKKFVKDKSGGTPDVAQPQKSVAAKV